MKPEIRKQKSFPKRTFHPRNKHQGKYNFKMLTKANPALVPFATINKYGTETINFSNQQAVKELNKALLLSYYPLEYWDIPKGFLCPPIPGRADYIHNLADLLTKTNNDKPVKGELITCLDIGVGANCIYPIIGVSEYNWNFLASDIDPDAFEACQMIIDKNPSLKGKIDLTYQGNRNHIFKGIIKKGMKVELVMCNPPFHESAEDARKNSARKESNLKGKRITNPTLNFGGKSKELWCEGGERGFVKRIIKESEEFGSSCLWFTSLVSKESNLQYFYHLLNQKGAKQVKTIPMGQGNKVSRIIAWNYLSKKEQQDWMDTKK